MLASIIIGLWAVLWTGPLTDPDEIFGLVKMLFSKLLTPLRGVRLYIYKILIGCAKCHAGQVALWYCVYSDYSFWHSFKIVIIAIFIAYKFEK